MAPDAARPADGGSPDAALARSAVIAPLQLLAPVDASSDPLRTHRPQVVDCNGLVGWYPEQGALEVNTGQCNYLALTEPAAADAPKGATLVTRLSYFDLTSPEPAEVHVAVLLRSEILWETAISVPSSARVLELSFPLTRAVHVGDSLGFHLHNHGQNTYTFEPLVAHW